MESDLCVSVLKRRFDEEHGTLRPPSARQAQDVVPRCDGLPGRVSEIPLDRLQWSHCLGRGREHPDLATKPIPDAKLDVSAQVLH